MIDFLMGRHRFYVSKDYWCGYELECLMRKFGIRIYGRDAGKEYITFTVKEKQANYAEYLLIRAGFEIRNKLRNPANAKHAPDYYNKHPSIPTGGGGGTKRDLITALFDFVAPFMGSKPQMAHEWHNVKVESRKKGKPTKKRVKK